MNYLKYRSSRPLKAFPRLITGNSKALFHLYDNTAFKEFQDISLTSLNIIDYEHDTSRSKWTIPFITVPQTA